MDNGLYAVSFASIKLTATTYDPEPDAKTQKWHLLQGSSSLLSLIWSDFFTKLSDNNSGPPWEFHEANWWDTSQFQFTTQPDPCQDIQPISKTGGS